MINFYEYEDKLVKVVTTDENIYIGFVRDLFDAEDTGAEDECTIEIMKVVKGNNSFLHQEPVFEASYIKTIELIEKY